jgi:vacuolar-type H+-ATPase subunit I/STV1
MFRKIDESQFLSNLIQQTSNTLAKKRGLLPIIGIAMVILSLLIQSSNVFLDSNMIELIGVIVHHAGVLIALIGLLIITPIGK